VEDIKILTGIEAHANIVRHVEEEDGITATEIQATRIVVLALVVNTSLPTLIEVDAHLAHLEKQLLLVVTIAEVQDEHATKVDTSMVIVVDTAQVVDTRIPTPIKVVVVNIARHAQREDGITATETQA
jgi:hypothetical protein